MNQKEQQKVVQPVTFLHAEVCQVEVLDQQQQGCASENDTYIDGSGDSDTQ